MNNSHQLQLDMEQAQTHLDSAVQELYKFEEEIRAIIMKYTHLSNTDNKWFSCSCEMANYTRLALSKYEKIKLKEDKRKNQLNKTGGKNDI